MIVIIERHLQIQTNKLRQVPVSVRIFSPKNGTNRENLLKISCDRHLLVKLGALCQIRRTLKVADSENICAALGSGRYYFRRVYFYKSFRSQRFPEQPAHSGFESENRLVRWSAQVQYAVV